MANPSDKLEKVRLLLASRRTFGTPGAALTWGIAGADKGIVHAGMQGELAVGKVLNQYAAEHDGIHVFHSVRWPGDTDADTDHVVVAGTSVVIVDAKRWKAKRKYSVTARGAVMRGTVRFDAGKVKMLPALEAWRRTLPRSATVTGVVCVAQKDVYVPYDDHWRQAPFKLVTIEQLPAFFDRYLLPRVNRQQTTSTQVALPIMERLIKPKPGPEKIDFSR